MEDKDIQVLIDCADKELLSYRQDNTVSCLNEIVNLANSGNEQAFIYLLSILHHYVIGWSYSLIYNFDDIDMSPDDICQETFYSLIKQFKSRKKIIDNSKLDNKSFFVFLSYVRSINFRTILQHKRSMKALKRYGNNDYLDLYENIHISQDNPISDTEMRLSIIEIIMNILDKDEIIIFMHKFIREKRTAEISEEINMDEHTVNASIQRILRKLRASKDLEDLWGHRLERQGDLNRLWAESIAKLFKNAG